MAIHVGWENETHKTILVTYERAWTWEDFASSKVEIDTLLNSVDYPVNIISDSRQSMGLPHGNALSVLARSFQSAPSNVAIVAVLGANPFFKSLLQILQTVSLNRAAKNIRFVKTEEDAQIATRAA
ncbi:MAG: hypothetical protein ABI970_20640 [Chloroflexota bacterium]|nr:hypothetical protein [Anaerolineae bacterium]